jgi:hypothetical protein
MLNCEAFRGQQNSQRIERSAGIFAEGLEIIMLLYGIIHRKSDGKSNVADRWMESLISGGLSVG